MDRQPCPHPLKEHTLDHCQYAHYSPIPIDSSNAFEDSALAESALDLDGCGLVSSGHGPSKRMDLVLCLELESFLLLVWRRMDRPFVKAEMYKDPHQLMPIHPYSNFSMESAFCNLHDSSFDLNR